MNSKLLQDSRKKEIPELVNKYNAQIKVITDAVSKPVPDFKDMRSKKDDDSGDEIVITAEQQLFSFIAVRVRAIDAADDISRKVNQLELELNAPEVYAEIAKVQDKTAAPEKKPETRKPRNHARENAQ